LEYIEVANNTRKKKLQKLENLKKLQKEDSPKKLMFRFF